MMYFALKTENCSFKMMNFAALIQSVPTHTYTDPQLKLKCGEQVRGRTSIFRIGRA